MKYHEWVLEAGRRSRKDKIKIHIIPASTYRDRERKLTASGLLDWERFWLVSHRLNSPGMREMLKERKIVLDRAKDRKLSVLEYRREISNWYKRRGWTFNNGNMNPFDMMEYYRDKAGDEKDKWPYSKKVPRVRKDYRKAKKAMLKREKEKPFAPWLFRPPVRPV